MAVKVGQPVAFYPAPGDPGYANVAPGKDKLRSDENPEPLVAVRAYVRALDGNGGDAVSLAVDGVTIDDVPLGEGEPHTYRP